MSRKQMFHTFKEVQDRGAFDEYPMLPDGADPQLHLSRNDRAQPFYLICEKDTVLVQMSGNATVHFAEGELRYTSAKPGDFIYVPAGTPHRVVPESESVNYRYKAAKPGLEAVAFHCEGCGAELLRETWDTEREISQSRYAKACAAFDSDEAIRTCAACGTVNPKTGFDISSWQAIAEQLKAEGS